MKKISSHLTIILKFTFAINGLCLIAFSLFFFKHADHKLPVFFALLLGILFIGAGKWFKDIYVDKNEIFIKGVFFRKRVPKSQALQITSLFNFFFLKTQKGTFLFQVMIKDLLKSDSNLKDELNKLLEE